MLEKPAKRHRRHKRIRAKIFGMAKVPRLCVFRSAKHIYGQLIDDIKKQTLVEASDLELRKQAAKHKETKSKAIKERDNGEKVRTKKVAVAFDVGKLIAEKALKKKIERVVFDRGGYNYHGRVKAVAEGAREGGLKF